MLFCKYLYNVPKSQGYKLSSIKLTIKQSQTLWRELALFYFYYMLTTHADLIAHKWAKVTCIIEWTEITDARIQVENDQVFICQNEIDWCECEDKLWYKSSWSVSTEIDKYEKANQSCTNIALVEEYKLWDIISTEWLVGFERETCKELGLKEGDLVVDIGGRFFREWEVISLKTDDNSKQPLFTNWSNAWYIYTSDIAPLPTNKKPVKQTKVTQKSPTYQTIIRRDDGLEFTEDKIGNETIQEITDRRKKLMTEANQITALLRKHKSLTF